MDLYWQAATTVQHRSGFGTKVKADGKPEHRYVHTLYKARPKQRLGRWDQQPGVCTPQNASRYKDQPDVQNPQQPLSSPALQAYLAQRCSWR